MTPYQIPGGNYIRRRRVHQYGVRGRPNHQSRQTRTGNVSAFNDIVVSPSLSAGIRIFSLECGRVGWMPAGDYDKTRLVNTGRNYWSVVPQFSATYFDPKAGWDVSASSMYIVSYENTATHYNSGDVIQIDLAAGKMISPQFKLGVVGYYLQHVTADSGIGDILGDRKLRVAGVGPAATFSFSVTMPVNPRQIRIDFPRKTPQSGTSICRSAPDLNPRQRCPPVCLRWNFRPKQYSSSVVAKTQPQCSLPVSDCAGRRTVPAGRQHCPAR